MLLYKDFMGIMRLCNRRAILKALKKLGYKDTCKAERFKDFSIANILKGGWRELAEITNKNETLMVKGVLFTNVEGAEQYEFFVLQTNCYTRKHEFKMYHLDIWYKEVE